MQTVTRYLNILFDIMYYDILISCLVLLPGGIDIIQIYHTVNRLRNFLSSCQSGQSVQSGYLRQSGQLGLSGLSGQSGQLGHLSL